MYPLGRISRHFRKLQKGEYLAIRGPKRQRNDGESFEVEEMNKEVDTNEEGEIENEHGEKDEPGEEPLKEITAGETAEGKKDDANYISKRKSSKGLPKKGSKRILNKKNMKREDETTGTKIPEKDVISSPNSTSKKSKRIKTEVNAKKDKGETENKPTVRKGPRGKSKKTDKQGKSVNSGEDVVTEEASDEILGMKPLKSPSKRMTKQHDYDFVDADNAVSISLDTPSIDVKESRKEMNTPYESDISRGKRQRKKQSTEMAGERFNQDFRERKTHMKYLIQEELTRIAEEYDEDNAEENQDEG